MAENELRHGSMLHLSGEGVVSLTAAVSDRYNRLIGDFQRIKGSALQVPKDMIPDYQRFMNLIRRYKKNDMRHTDAEARSLKTIAQWTLDINNAIRNQPAEQLDCLKNE